MRCARTTTRSRLLIRPGARLYTLPLGHTFLNNTDGVFGYYLKRVDGAVMESYNPTFAFYPASTIKVLQHLHAMRAVDAGTVTLNGTNLNVCTGSTNCTDNANTVALCGGSRAIETLNFALGRMMINSDNEDTNAVQELFGNGNPIAGRAAMNQTAWNVAGMSNSTELHHKFNCNNVSNNPYNTLTLADAGLLYEQTMTNDAVLPEPTRTTFVQIMFNETNDNSLVTAINSWTRPRSTPCPASTRAQPSCCARRFGSRCRFTKRHNGQPAADLTTPRD